MKIAVNAMVIDNKKAGVGNYAYNLVKHLIKSNMSKEYLIDIFAQKNYWDKNGLGRVTGKNISHNYLRILYEQLVLPIKYKQYDLVHCLDYQAPFFQGNNKFIITVHDLSYFLYDDLFTKGQQVYKKINAAWGIKRAKKIITDAYSTKKDILRLFPDINEEKIKVIYLGVNPIFKEKLTLSEIENVIKEYEINGDYILYVGTLEPRKNINTLLDSFNIVTRRYNRSIKLVIAGKKGWLYDEVFQKVKEYNLEKKVIFTGYVSDNKLPALYKGAKLFVYPSLYEGFGLPPLEAMACGTPVITSNTSSLPEIVDEAAVMVEPSNTEQLTDKILLLLNKEKLRREYIIKGKKRADFFNWSKTTEETLKVYQEIKENAT